MTTLEQQAGSAIRPFSVAVPDDALADLRRRLAAARWPTRELVTDRSQGVQLATMQRLCEYWATEYDWRRCEARLNALPQFMTEIDGVDIHFLHVRSPHPDALPLIMTHGWPGSVPAGWPSLLSATRSRLTWMPSRPFGAWRPIESVTAAPWSPPCAT